MKFLISTVYFVVFTFVIKSGFGQGYYQDQFILKNQVYGINAQKNDELVKVKISLDEKKGEFELLGLKLSVFKLLFKKAITTDIKHSGIAESDSIMVLAKAEEVYTSMLINLIASDSETPKSGVMTFHERVIVEPRVLVKQYDKLAKLKKRVRKSSKPATVEKRQEKADEFEQKIDDLTSKVENYRLMFVADTIQIEIVDGSIRNFIVEGRLASAEDFKKDLQKIHFFDDVSFRNIKPISISSLYDVRIMKEAILQNSHDRYDLNVISLGKIIKYNPIISLKSDDYSPKDQVYRVERVRNKKLQEKNMFFKEETKYLFIGRVFSDFTGFSEDNPNGLIQTELGRKIIINAQNALLSPFAYFEPEVRLSKIENKLRDLEISGTTMSALSIPRFSYLNFRGTLNLLTWNIPAFKMVLELNVLGESYWTSIERQANAEPITELSWRLGPQASVEFRPDTRWTMSFSYSQSRLDNLNSEFQVINRELHEVTVDVSWRPNGDRMNEIFLRTTSTSNNIVESFQQFQLGYTFPLIKSN